MRQTILALCAVIAAAACSRQEPVPAAPADTATGAESVSWADFAAATMDEYYDRNPEVAVDAGKHEYDGKASDLSLAAADAYAVWLDETIAAAGEYADLEDLEAFERDYLVQALRGERFQVRKMGFLRNNPVAYMGRLGFGVYVDREYAPLEQRLRAYTTYIAEVPRMLGQMRENLEPPLPAPYVETAHGMFAGLADYLENTVPGLFADVDDEDLQREFSTANTAAIRAVSETAAWLDGLSATATDDFALGAERFLEMLRERRGSTCRSPT